MAPPLTRASSSSVYVAAEKVTVELIPNGADTVVNNSNRNKFVRLLAKMHCLNGGEDSIAAMRRGLLKIYPQRYLSMLNPSYLSVAIRGELSVITDQLRESVVYDSGYSASHRVVRMFWHMVLTEFTPDDVRKLLLFWTGSSVPSFPNSNADQDDRMTISKMYKPDHPIKKESATDKPRLPEASTCDKHLYLPGYRTLDEMRTAVRAAIEYSCLGYDRP